MDPELRLRERCIELALATGITHEQHVVIVATKYEAFIRNGSDRADRADAPAA